jgi:2-hydroxychromene-2-carboxylate isomerase
MPARVSVTHFSDPGCPWAYSASPAFAVLHWRYGDQLEWRLTMIGLAETAQRYIDRGYTPTAQARGYRRFRRFGMPFTTEPRERVPATARACRAVVAVRLTRPALEEATFRALQFAHFTSTIVFDTDEGVRAALEAVPGLDPDEIVGMLDAEEVTQAYERDRAEARTAAGSPTEFQGRAANSDGKVRYTAPSLVFRHTDGRVLEAGGFQPVEAYDVVIANLDQTLARRAPAGDVLDVLRAFPYPLATAEVAAVMAAHLTLPDPIAAEDALIEAAGAGAVRRYGVGDGALWEKA